MQTIEELQDIWMAPSGTELPFIGKNSKPREKSSYHTLERGYVANQTPEKEEKSSMNVYLVLSMESEAAQVIFFPPYIGWPVILSPAPTHVKKQKCWGCGEETLNWRPQLSVSFKILFLAQSPNLVDVFPKWYTVPRKP